MLKSVAWTAVVVGSLAAAVACSSKSSSGGNFNGGDASNEEDGSSSSGSSSGGSSEAGGGCANPLGAVQAITGMAVSSACTSCVNSSCSSSLSTCMAAATCESTECLGVLECVESSCKVCLPDAGSSSSSSSSGGSSGSDAGTKSGEGGSGDACSQLQTCCGVFFGISQCGCAAIADVESSEMAACTTAVSSDNTSECSGYMSAISAGASALGATSTGCN